MKSPHQYKRRTYDEARALAAAAVREQIRSHLSSEVIDEMRQFATEVGGSVQSGWQELLGCEPEQRMHYEHAVYRPSDHHPYIERYYFRALVSRDRSVDQVWILWQPPVPNYPPPPERPKPEIPAGYVRLHD